MVRTFFDLKKLEEENPRPNILGEDEPWNPFSPRKQVLREYAENKYPYEKTVHDRAGDEFYALVRGKPEKMSQEVVQCYRINIPLEGEFMFYNVTVRGEDWKGNEHDYALLEGRYSMPIFRREKDPQTDKVTSSQINDHKYVCDIPWSKEKFDELLKSAVDNLSMAIYGTAGRRLSIPSVDDYRNGAIEDLIQCGMHGKSLESVLAEKNQFTYEKVAPKATKHN
jgi:hypothetical protein